MKENKKVYEMPKTEVVDMYASLSVLMASGAPEVTPLGTGFRFGEDNGSW